MTTVIVIIKNFLEDSIVEIPRSGKKKMGGYGFDPAARFQRGEDP
jgi:hypothetical protein